MKEVGDNVQICQYANAYGQAVRRVLMGLDAGYADALVGIPPGSAGLDTGCKELRVDLVMCLGC